MHERIIITFFSMLLANKRLAWNSKISGFGACLSKSAYVNHSRLAVIQINLYPTLIRQDLTEIPVLIHSHTKLFRGLQVFHILDCFLGADFL